MQLREQAEERRQQILNGRGSTNPYSAKERKKLAEIGRWQSEEMRKILTPTEYERYEMSVSGTADYVRSQLGEFGATESEYRAIYKAQSEINSSMTGLSPEDRQNQDRLREVAENRARIREGLRDQLGDGRYEEYQRYTSSQYERLSRIGREQSLSRDAINQAYDVNRQAQEQQMRVMLDNSLAPDAKRAAEEAIQTTTQAELTRLLGSEGYASFVGRPGNLSRQ